ncbi:MAG: hypothetical protein HY703_04890, partial [Gemmatimonadetes bacterium]|nr:hypothetical protein [Gemmatimonadota bacterium]
MAENRCPKCGASFMGAAVCPRCKAANPKRLKVKRGQEVEVFVPAKIEWVKGRVTDPKQG